MNHLCIKCKAPMPPIPPPPPGSRSPMDTIGFTVTGFRCEKCGHWNNLKARKK